MYGLNDPLLEATRAIVLAALLVYLVVYGRRLRFFSHSGSHWIVAGFSLLLFATLIDITDEIPGLERYVVIGATDVQTYIETFCGYLPGFLALFIGFVKFVPSLARLAQLSRDLAASEARFRLVFAASPDPLLIARVDGPVLDVNRVFEAETGIRREEALGKTPAEIALWVDPAAGEAFLQRLRQEGAVVNREAQLRAADGEVRSCLVSAQLIELDGIDCMLLASRDITRQKEAEGVLLEMDRMKSEFISTAAHELRTPLTTILGYAELLSVEDGDDQFPAEKRAEFFGEIAHKGEKLCAIIDEMLDIGRIESGQKIPLDRQPQSSGDLIGKAVRQFELLSPRHTFAIESPGGEFPLVNCDARRISQVLENLLSNAVKYSPQGGTIVLRSESIDGHWVVSVIDHGIGMSPEQAARIFDKFYRADASHTAISGLGLGMSIVLQIVELHHGRIWVESEPGQGTTVSFSLPLNVEN